MERADIAASPGRREFANYKRDDKSAARSDCIQNRIVLQED